MDSSLCARRLRSSHSEAFRAICDQVEVHCTERGQLLHRVRRFFTSGTEISTKLAEESVRGTVRKEISALQRQVLELREENAQLRSGKVKRQVAEKEQLMVDTWGELDENSRHRVLSRLFGDGADRVKNLQMGMLLMEVDAITDKETLLEAEQQAEVFDELVSKLYENEVVQLLRTIVVRGQDDFQEDVLAAIFEAIPSDRLLKTIGAALSSELRNSLCSALFEAQSSLFAKGRLLAEIMTSWKPDDRLQILAATLKNLELPETLFELLKILCGDYDHEQQVEVAFGVLGVVHRNAAVDAIKAFRKELSQDVIAPLFGTRTRAASLLHASAVPPTDWCWELCADRIRRSGADRITRLRRSTPRRVHRRRRS